MGAEKVMSFMDRLEETNDREDQYNDIKNDVDVKLRCLHDNKEKGCEKCVNKIINDIYTKAVPLSNDYKTAYKDELDNDFPNFVKTKIEPNGTQYYIHEAIKKGNPFAKRLVSAIEKVVNDDLKDKEYDIENIAPEDLVFKMSDDNIKKLDVVAADLSADELSDKIKDNVIASVSAEIRKSKEQKERDKQLEEDLKNDPKMISKEALESVMAYESLKKENNFYEPTLFESIMISKLNDITKQITEGTFDYKFNYDAKCFFESDYGLPKISPEIEEKAEESLMEDPNIEEYAFIEAVREFTCWNILKSLKLESLTPSKLGAISDMYAKS